MIIQIFFELSDVNSVNILESLNIPVGRINKDSGKNHNGSRLLDLCKGNDLLIINGRIGNDKDIGKLTCKQWCNG